ncbi:MAG: hypothetical protein EOO15_08555 [Chitinophagaceae bacterium]|nr:MAG: hypothetical protein EOO15_08555 [Chitinophagaceae bacterium]
MKRLPLFILSLYFAAPLLAQSFDYDRESGQVSVKGKPVFLLVKNNGALNYSVRSMGGLELIAVSNGEMNREGRGDMPGYKFTFSHSGSACSFMPTGMGFTAPKLIIGTILRNQLIAADTVNEEGERKFVEANRGQFFAATARQARATSQAPPIANPAPAPASAAPAAMATAGSLRLEGDKAYLGTRLLASFRDQNEGSSRIVNIYGTDDVLVARAARSLPENGDWSIELSPTKTSLQLRYYNDRSLERIFEFLLAKGHLK